MRFPGSAGLAILCAGGLLVTDAATFLRGRRDQVESVPMTPVWSYAFPYIMSAGPLLSVNRSLVYVGAGPHLLAVETDTGKKRWQVEIEGADALLHLTNSVQSRLGGEVVLATAFHHRTLYAFHANNGSSLWTYTADDIILTPPTLSRDGATAYVACRDVSIHAINVVTGHKRWVTNKDRPGVSSALLLSEDGGRLYAMNRMGGLLGINAKNGDTLWQAPSGLPYEVDAPAVLSQDGSVIYSPIKAATGTMNGVKATRTEDGVALWAEFIPDLNAPEAWPCEWSSGGLLVLLKDGHVALLSTEDGHVSATYDGSMGLLGSAHTLVADLQHQRVAFLDEGTVVSLDLSQPPPVTPRLQRLSGLEQKQGEKAPYITMLATDEGDGGYMYVGRAALDEKGDRHGMLYKILMTD